MALAGLRCQANIIIKGRYMKRKVGLWIDHRKAVIVAITDKGEEVSLISSNIEKHIRPSAHTKTSYVT